MEFTSEVAPRVVFETLRRTWPLESKHAKDEARPTVIVILKPPGQVGELSKNGYALKAELKWDIKIYREVQKFVRDTAKSRLSMQLSYAKQIPTEIDTVCELSAQKYNFLYNYKDCWPTRDMLIMMLKNSSRGARQSQQRSARG
ncbi:hypothetical protein HWV62_42434 [Athelia sp. TMB]|nr:hypothetical protein HWV62_42434 [Athelia sp. TMB]